MKVVSVTSDNQWYNLYTLSEIPSGSLVITNGTSRYLEILRSASQPSPADKGWPVETNATTVIPSNGLVIWIKATPSGPILVQELEDSKSPYVSASLSDPIGDVATQTFTGIEYLNVSLPPEDYITYLGERYLQTELPPDNYTNTFGKKKLKVELPDDIYTYTEEGLRRLRVDQGSTGFWRKKEFRTYKEFSIAAGQTLTMKFVVGTNTILQQAETVIDEGLMRLTIYIGGTDSVAFPTSEPVLPRNFMTTGPAPYVSQMQIFSGGTQTGGTLVDIIRIAAQSLGGRRATVILSQDDVRGIAPNTYYYKFENLGNSTVTGTFHGSWEERD